MSAWLKLLLACGSYQHQVQLLSDYPSAFSLFSQMTTTDTVNSPSSTVDLSTPIQHSLSHPVYVCMLNMYGGVLEHLL